LIQISKPGPDFSDNNQIFQELAMDALYKQALETFNALLEQAQQTQDPEPTAMTVATVGRDGRPAARTVLLKAVDARGFVFFTNFNSRKGRQLAANPQAALLFHWKFLMEGVQVKIEGTVEPVSAAEADEYFAMRPRGSQVGAWASLQSQPLASREVFEERVAEVEKRYDGMDVPRPPHWSGFRIVPERIEFWYGARFRLHERQCYERVDGVWTLGMLYP
jgi:pyridoxamine 5'-phosphate oxidase